MSPNPDTDNTFAVLLMRGKATFGMTHRHADGSVERTESKFEPMQDGPCVGIVPYDTEKEKVIGPVSVYGDYQQAEFLGEALKKLGPNMRPGNIPPIKDMFVRAGFLERECPLLDLCTNNSCFNGGIACIFYDWMEEGAEERRETHESTK